MADVFLSYARKDSAKAEQIRALLEAAGLSVFFDVDGLDGGDVFPDVLDREVKTAGAVLSLWTPHALSRPWVKIECRIAKERGVLVPVSVEPIHALNDVPAAFFDVQFIDLVDFRGDVDDPRWRKVLRSIARTIDRPDIAPPHTAADAARPAPPKRKPAAWNMVGALAALAVIAIGAVTLGVLRPWESDETGPPAPGSSAGLQAGSVLPGGPVAQAPLQSGPGVTPSPGGTTLNRAPADAGVDLAGFRADMAKLDLFDPAMDLRVLLEGLLARHPIATLEQAAETDADAAYLLAGAYNYGLFMPLDLPRAVNLFDRSCQQDFAPACMALATFYVNGQVIARDDATARNLHTRACDAGVMWACHYLGQMQTFAQGGPLDYASARRLQRRACDGGVMMACTAMGALELNGQGAPPDRFAARAMFDRACAGDELWGCNSAGMLRGQDGENSEAVRLYRKGCDGGYPNSCTMLGYHYAAGLGVTVNTAEARRFYQRACNSGDQMGCDYLAALPPG